MEIDKVMYCGLVLLCYLNLATGDTNDFRIIGGTKSLIEESPWLISIQHNRNHFCGGSIISSNTILTAAHCLYNKTLDSTFEVVAGVTDLRDDSEVRSSILEGILHPQYKSDIYDYDIAVLKIDNELKFSYRIKPVQLPEETYKLPDGSPLAISGWGVTSRTSKIGVKILESAVIYSINWNECHRKLSDVNPFTSRMFCAGVPTGEYDSCQGDSGGPVEANGTLFGIVSWGASCGYADYPGAYTNVPYFRSWIKEITGV